MVTGDEGEQEHLGGLVTEDLLEGMMGPLK